MELTMTRSRVRFSGILWSHDDLCWPYINQCTISFKCFVKITICLDPVKTFKITDLYCNICWNVIQSYDAKLIFHTSLLVFSVTWSFRNNSDMLLLSNIWCLSENGIENGCTAWHFCGNHCIFILRFHDEIKFKRTAFIGKRFFMGFFSNNV